MSGSPCPNCDAELFPESLRKFYPEPILMSALCRVCGGRWEYEHLSRDTALTITAKQKCPHCEGTRNFSAVQKLTPANDEWHRRGFCTYRGGKR
jgi:DnaJ-class molecular chaperone